MLVFGEVAAATMPGTWRRAKMRRIALLLSSERCSKAKPDVNGETPHPGQPVAVDSPHHSAGFFAEKGRRLGKPPRCPPTPLTGDGGAVFSTMATLASEIIAAITCTPAGNPPLDPAKADERQLILPAAAGMKLTEDEVFDAWSLPAPPQPATCGARSQKGEDSEPSTGAQALTSETLHGRPLLTVPRGEVRQAFEASTGGSPTPPQGEQRGELAPKPSRGAEGPEKEAPEGGSSRDFVAIAKAVVFLVILAIGRNKIFLGISILVLSALFIVAVMKCLFTVPRPREEAEKSSDGAGEGGALPSGKASALIPLLDGLDSNTSEQIQTESSYTREPYSGYDKSWDVKSPPRDAPPAVPEPGPAALEEKRHLEAVVVGDQRPRRIREKTNKLFKKFVRRSSGESGVERKER